MNKWRIKLLPWIFVISFLLVGCGNHEINKGEQNKEDVSSEQIITVSDCIPLESILALCHRDGGGDYRYMDPIPSEYWNIEDETTGSKGIAAQFDGKIYKLYANGKIVDESGNIKQKAPQNSNDEESIFTAWVLVLREDDMLGRDAVYNNMSYDIENAITVDELRNLIHVVYITEENFEEYFTFIEVEEEKEITGSSFEENHLYKPYRTLRIAYKGPGYLMNSGSFEWTVDVALSYKEKYNREEYDSQGTVIDNRAYDPEEKSCEVSADDYKFLYQEEGEYRNISYDNAFPNFWPLLQYNSDPEHTYSTKKQYTYEDITVNKAKGYLIYCEDMPEEFWNVTEKGNRYICVKREDKSAWRFGEYGRIGANNTDVDAFLEEDITATIDGEPKERRSDILCINGNDLNNFIGIELESLPGYIE